MYQATVELARRNAGKICEQAAWLVKERNLAGYQTVDSGDLAQRLDPFLQIVLDYLETDDLDNWQERLVALVNERAKQGFSRNAVMQAGRLLLQTLLQFCREALLGQAVSEEETPDRVLSKLERRLQNFETLAGTVTLLAGLGKNFRSNWLT